MKLIRALAVDAQRKEEKRILSTELRSRDDRFGSCFSHSRTEGMEVGLL